MQKNKRRKIHGRKAYTRHTNSSLREEFTFNSTETFALLNEFYIDRKSVLLEISLANSYWEQQMLNEGWGTDLAQKALQFVMSAAVEYGISVTTLGVGAAGPAEVAETLVDAFFTGSKVLEIVSSITSVFSKAKEFASLFNDVVNLVKNGASDLEGLYSSICEIVGKAFSILGQGAEDKITTAVQNFADKLKKIVADMVKKITSGVSSVIKLFVPEATVGTLVAEGLEALLNSMTDNCFDMISGVVKKAGAFGKLFTDVNKAPNLFKKMIDGLIKIIDGVKKEIEDAGLIKSMLAGPTGLLFKTVGKAGLEKLLGFIKEKKDGILTLINEISSKFIPAVWSILGVAQCLLRGDYNDHIEGSDEEGDEESTDSGDEEDTEDQEESVNKRKILITKEKKKGRASKRAA